MTNRTTFTRASATGNLQSLVTNYNANLDALEVELENSLSRKDNILPNSMEDELDMNGNDIINVNEIDVLNLTINGTPVQPFAGVTVASAFQNHTFTATLGQTSFSIAPYTAYVTSVQVEVNGLALPPADISVSGTNVIIPACTAGDEVVIRRYTSAPSPFPSASDITFNQAGTVNTRSVQNKLRDVISVKDFGAVGDGVTDDTAAIQAALNSAAGLGTSIYIPVGIYKTTSVLTIPDGLNGMYGAGQGSVIRPTACNCFQFSASNTVGTRRIADFWIYGNGTTSNTAITCNLDSGAGGRVTGLLLENVYISFYGVGIYARGLWNATFRKVVVLNTWKPLQLVGRNIKTLITDCNFTLGSGTGTGNSTGVLVDQLGGVRPEDTWIVNSIIYGFDNAVNWASGLFGGVTGCDLDVCTKEAVIATVTDGGFVVENNWITVYNAAYAVYGVKLNSVGTLQTPGVRKISGNTISSYTAAPANSVGIFAGTLTNNVNVTGNVVSSFETGIHINASSGFTVKDNTTSDTTSRGLYLESSESGTVADNTFDAIIQVNASNTAITFGKNAGASSTYLIGQLTIPAGVTTVTATLASLGIPNIPTNVTPHTKFMYYGGLNRGAIWGNCFSNTLTLNLTVAAGSADAIHYEVTCAV